MAEKVQLAAKTSKVKENSASTTRKIESPQSMSSPADQVLYLQRTIGNQAVQRLIKSGALQAKLKIGQPGDRYEQEADRVADAVMRMPEPQVRRQSIEEEEEEQIQTKPVIEQITPLVQRQVEEEEELRRQSIEDVEEVQTKTTSDLIPEVQPNIEYHFLSLKGGGQPLSESDRAFFEPRFGRDFSQVRVHTDSQAAETAQAVNARAYTMGRDVVFGTGQYAPETNAGKGLLAHELTHLVQRGLDSSSNKIQRVVEDDITRMSITKDWAINLNDAELEGQINIVRDQLLTLDLTTPEYTAARQNLRILEAEATLRLRLQCTKVEEYGIAYKKEGVNLRDQPASNPDSKVLVRLQFNSRMYLDSEVDGYYFVGTDDGQFGYVATSHVKPNLPEPNAKIYHIEAGDTALGISRQHYGGEAKWGRDHRFFVNGLVYINHGTGERGIYKPDDKADWDTTEVRAGYMIWVPSLKFMQSLQGVVKSESITYEAWQTVKDVATDVGEFLLGTGAFVVGLLHGALESVWDIFVGLKDLAVMAWDLVKWLFGLITGDSKGLFDSLKGINWGELVQGWIDDFVAKWDNESVLKRWHFRGWVYGYAIAEVLMLIFSGGIIQGIKWVGKSAKVAKVISKLPKIAKLAEVAKASKEGQKFLKVLQATKGAKVPVKAPLTSALIGRGDRLAQALKWKKPLKGWYDIVVHGSPTSFHVFHNGKWVKIDHRSLATFMKKTGYKGEPVRLISCSTGGGISPIAKDLSNKIGAKVMAPSDALWIHPNGNMTIGPTYLKPTGSWNQFSPFGIKSTPVKKVTSVAKIPQKTAPIKVGVKPKVKLEEIKNRFENFKKNIDPKGIKGAPPASGSHVPGHARSKHGFSPEDQAKILNEPERIFSGKYYKNRREVDIYYKNGAVVITEAGKKESVITAYGKSIKPSKPSKIASKPVNPDKWGDDPDYIEFEKPNNVIYPNKKRWEEDDWP